MNSRIHRPARVEVHFGGTKAQGSASELRSRRGQNSEIWTSTRPAQAKWPKIVPNALRLQNADRPAHGGVFERQGRGTLVNWPVWPKIAYCKPKKALQALFSPLCKAILAYSMRFLPKPAILRGCHGPHVQKHRYLHTCRASWTRPPVTRRSGSACA